MLKRIFVLFVFAISAASAQPYPAKPVKIVVAFPPGGGNDFIARFIAQRLGLAMGQQILVENKPGAGGTIGVEFGVRAAPDGYTLTLISNSYTVNPSLYKVRFDPVADITPIIQVSQGPYLIVVHPAVPAKNLAELLDIVRSRPEQINFASSGQRSEGHLATPLFASMSHFNSN